jgi:hypothetical protein
LASAERVWAYVAQEIVTASEQNGHDSAFQSSCGGYLFEKRSISDCLGYGSESVGSGLAGGAAAAVELGAGDAPGE